MINRNQAVAVIIEDRSINTGYFFDVVAGTITRTPERIPTGILFKMNRQAFPCFDNDNKYVGLYHFDAGFVPVHIIEFTNECIKENKPAIFNRYNRNPTVHQIVSNSAFDFLYSMLPIELIPHEYDFDVIDGTITHNYKRLGMTVLPVSINTFPCFDIDNNYVGIYFYNGFVPAKAIAEMFDAEIDVE